MATGQRESEGSGRMLYTAGAILLVFSVLGVFVIAIFVNEMGPGEWLHNSTTNLTLALGVVLGLLGISLIPALRLGRTASVLLCVSSIALGVCLLYVGLADDNLWTSPLAASSIAYIVTGAVGIVFAQGFTAFRKSEMASMVIVFCIAVTTAVISLITYYAATLGFGTA